MENSYSFKSLINRTISGNREAFEQLILSQKNTISFQISRVTKCREDIEDISQKVAIQVYQRIGSLKYPEAFTSWLKTIVSRECSRHFKSSDQSVSIEDVPGYEDYFHETDTDYLPHVYAEKAEQSKEITKAVNKLPETSRKMVVFHYNGGMTYKEIADRMGVTVSNVSVNLFRAKKRLRGELCPS